MNSCKNCKFYFEVSRKRFSIGKWATKLYRLCRRYPPSSRNEDDLPEQILPHVSADFWCGEHQAIAGQSPKTTQETSPAKRKRGRPKKDPVKQ